MKTPSEFLKEYRIKLQNEILAEHASLCPPDQSPLFTSRSMELKAIGMEMVEVPSFVWKEEAIKDEGLSLEKLMAVHNLVKKRKAMYTK